MRDLKGYLYMKDPISFQYDPPFDRWSEKKRSTLEFGEAFSKKRNSFAEFHHEKNLKYSQKNLYGGAHIYGR